MADTSPTGLAGTAAHGSASGSTPAATGPSSHGAGSSPSLPPWEQHLRLGRQCLAQGDMAGAEREYRAAVVESEAAGADSPQFASALSNLGQLRYQQKKFADAAELFRRALEVREHLVGTEHFSLVQSINNLAAAEVALSDLAAAEPLLQRALVLTERHYGAEHPDVATCLSNLSRLYFRRGAYAAAEPILQRLLVIKQAQGADHPEVASVLANLATVRQMLGQYDSAEELWRHVLSIRERSLSANAPALATTLENLADTCAAGGKVSEALALRERALAIHEQTLGADHPTVASARAKIVGLQLETSMEGLDGTLGDMFVPVGPVGSVPPVAPRPSSWVPVVRPSGDQGPRMFGEVEPHAPRGETPAMPSVVVPRATAPSQQQITAESLSALLSEVEAEHQEPRSPIAASAMVVRDFARSMLGKRRSEPEAQPAAEPQQLAAHAPTPPQAEAPRREVPLMIPEAKALAVREPDATDLVLEDESDDAAASELTDADAALVGGGRKTKTLAVLAGVATVAVALAFTAANMGGRPTSSPRAAEMEPTNVTAQQPANVAPAAAAGGAALGADSLVAQTRALAAGADSSKATTTHAAAPAPESRSEGSATTRQQSAAARERSEQRGRADSGLAAPKAMSAMETIRTAVDLIQVSYQIDSTARSRVDTVLNPATRVPANTFKAKPIVPRQ